eukprot:TRINITY_DN27614_c0_g1_i2.p3 TRINITY_DN27614_c0_g1~~TRINITY_DN27614_c0_g1_i2.p3  ORF type:complete len:136 (-),score=15.65 TRINITY_DN27614_c0_g1_i2:17-424(-)
MQAEVGKREAHQGREFRRVLVRAYGVQSCFVVFVTCFCPVTSLECPAAVGCRTVGCFAVIRRHSVVAILAVAKMKTGKKKVKKKKKKKKEERRKKSEKRQKKKNRKKKRRKEQREPRDKTEGGGGPLTGQSRINF